MKYMFVAFALLGISIYLIDYRAVGQEFDVTGDSPIVVELYTSQSCSSCPPADKVLAEIAKQPNVIALGCHVTYWNHLHWKDTLSLKECTDRQRAFNGSINSGRVYTPQMVVNGDDEFVGSRRGQAISSLENATPLASIRVTQSGDDIYAVYPNLNAKRALTIEWIGYNDKFYQEIPSGENRGHDITYSNPVQNIIYNRVEDSSTSSFIKKSKFNADNVAVLIRDQKAGKIVTAGKIKL